jgi:hypothetical protein
MKITAEEREAYRVLFKSILGYSVFAFCAYFLSRAAFTSPDQLNEHTGTIVGFITGSAFSLVLGFYFGSSDKKITPSDFEIEKTPSKIEVECIEGPPKGENE